MGETLGIAHNVFEKMEREKDRKERMKKYEEWQKEQEKRKQRLRDIHAKIKEAERYGGNTPDSQSPLVSRKGASTSSLIDQDQDSDKKDNQSRKFDMGRSDKKASLQNITLQEITGTSPTRKTMGQRTTSSFSRIWQRTSFQSRRCESQDPVANDSTDNVNDSVSLVGKHYLKPELRPWSKSVAEFSFATTNDQQIGGPNVVRKASDFDQVETETTNAKTLKNKCQSTPGLLGDDQESDSMDGHIIMNFDITESSSQISNEVLERQMSRLSLRCPRDQQPVSNCLEKFMEEGMDEKDTKNFIFYEKDEHPSRCGQCIIL